MRYPTISVIIATFNSGKLLDRCLSLVRNQNYPQDKIEIVLGDGGSTDSTQEIAKKYKARVITIPKQKQHAEYNRGMAFNKAKGELALILDHDNFLPYKDWLKDMVKPLLENKDVVAVNTCYYKYEKNYDLMDRYFALYGTSEPLPYFLKKADRMPFGINKWTLVGDAEDKGDYYLVTFSKDPRKFPSIGSNGCLMRRKLVIENAKADPNHHYPIDVLFDVTQKGFNKYAWVKNSIIHLTHSEGFFEFIKRRKKFVEQYHFEEYSKRRWSVVLPGDNLKVLLFVIYSLTLVFPTIEAFRGYLRIRDVAWFIHPLMCLGTTVIYGYVTLKFSLLKMFKNE